MYNYNVSIKNRHITSILHGVNGGDDDDKDDEKNDEDDNFTKQRGGGWTEQK